MRGREFNVMGLGQFAGRAFRPGIQPDQVVLCGGHGFISALYSRC